ncbi:hypothetical protein [Aurantiacibacter luteus]|uniref:Lipoprotein n=1 Tax=Aurantiacibacter luteus TaxID=1581420 RepID=A0A0G9MUU1_9SPHN|nr:hypothetical protein [Aurantiacibacter luteus]KLE34334.1 hypothetical protein AAW00_08815 [Aurantiacibacter luteus]
MNRKHTILIVAPLLVAGLGGCLAKTAVDVVTAPVRIASRAVDLATVSQSERDEQRGREIRRREERLAELQGDYADKEERCLAGNDRACREAVELRAEIDALLPTIPVEPEED